MTPKPKVPLLGKTLARSAQQSVEVNAALNALATGRAVTVKVMTEEELRAEFEAWWDRQSAGDLDAVPITAMIAASAFGALARAKGIVK